MEQVFVVEPENDVVLRDTNSRKASQRGSIGLGLFWKDAKGMKHSLLYPIFSMKHTEVELTQVLNRSFLDIFNGLRRSNYTPDILTFNYKIGKECFQEQHDKDRRSHYCKEDDGNCLRCGFPLIRYLNLKEKHRFCIVCALMNKYHPRPHVRCVLHCSNTKNNNLGAMFVLLGTKYSISSASKSKKLTPAARELAKIRLENVTILNGAIRFTYFDCIKELMGKDLMHAKNLPLLRRTMADIEKFRNSVGPYMQRKPWVSRGITDDDLDLSRPMICEKDRIDLLPEFFQILKEIMSDLMRCIDNQITFVSAQVQGRGGDHMPKKKRFSQSTMTSTRRRRRQRRRTKKPKPKPTVVQQLQREVPFKRFMMSTKRTILTRAERKKKQAEEEQQQQQREQEHDWNYNNYNGGHQNMPYYFSGNMVPTPGTRQKQMIVPPPTTERYSYQANSNNGGFGLMHHHQQQQQHQQQSQSMVPRPRSVASGQSYGNKYSTLMIEGDHIMRKEKEDPPRKRVVVVPPPPVSPTSLLYFDQNRSHLRGYEYEGRKFLPNDYYMKPNEKFLNKEEERFHRMVLMHQQQRQTGVGGFSFLPQQSMARRKNLEIPSAQHLLKWPLDDEKEMKVVEKKNEGLGEADRMALKRVREREEFESAPPLKRQKVE